MFRDLGVGSPFEAERHWIALAILAAGVAPVVRIVAFFYRLWP